MLEVHGPGCPGFRRGEGGRRNDDGHGGHRQPCPTTCRDSPRRVILRCVTAFLTTFDLVYAAARVFFLVAAVVAAVAFGLDWMVRTRRISPFSPVARFTRRAVQPLVRPVEQRVLRAGGSPHTAPWWALVVVVVGGIIVLSLLGFLRDQVVMAAMALRQGSAGMYYLAVTWASAVLQIALIVRVISSWVGGTPFSPWWRWSYLLTDWIIVPLRRVVPTLGMIDITPIVAYFLVQILAGLLLRL